MENAINKYWSLRLEACKETLIANQFGAYIANDFNEAKQLVLNKIIPKSNTKTFGYAGSLTVEKTGILDTLRNNPQFEVIETFDKPAKNREEVMERARHALLADMFITGTNAITETGILVNLDMWGNRVGAIAYGPKNVIIIVGRNKLVPDLEEAMKRVKNFAAPVNAIRHDMHRPRKTPCVVTSFCNDCNNDWRICNVWVIVEKSFPKGRINVVLVNEDLGF